MFLFETVSGRKLLAKHQCQLAAAEKLARLREKVPKPKGSSQTLGLIHISDVLTCPGEPEALPFLGPKRKVTEPIFFPIQIRNQGTRRWILMFSYFLWPGASHQGWDSAVQPLGFLPEGLMGPSVHLKGTEGMVNAADRTRPDILSHPLRN